MRVPTVWVGIRSKNIGDRRSAFSKKLAENWQAGYYCRWDGKARAATQSLIGYRSYQANHNRGNYSLHLQQFALHSASYSVWNCMICGCCMKWDVRSAQTEQFLITYDDPASTSFKRYLVVAVEGLPIKMLLSPYLGYCYWRHPSLAHWERFADLGCAGVARHNVPRISHICPLAAKALVCLCMVASIQTKRWTQID